MIRPVSPLGFGPWHWAENAGQVMFGMDPAFPLFGL